MSMSFGSTGLGELYVGDVKIAEAYKGSVLVYSAAHPATTYTMIPYTNANTVASYSVNSNRDAISGSCYVPNSGTISAGTLVSITFGSYANQIPLRSYQYFYRWNTTTALISQYVRAYIGLFAVDASGLTRSQVGRTTYGWRSSSEPVFLANLSTIGQPPTSSTSVSPPANTTITLDNDITDGTALVIAPYVKDGNYTFFGTGTNNNYGGRSAYNSFTITVE